jgi:hypothetical protein
MQWQVPDKLPDIQNTVTRFALIDRTVNRNKVKMYAAGTPCTYWRNMAITGIGSRPVSELKCYCWALPDGTAPGTTTVTASPDKKHFLCGGTGIIGGGSLPGVGTNLTAVGGYQKYGYIELTMSTPSTITKSTSNIVLTGTRGSAFTLSGTATSGTLTTERFSLYDFREVDHFLVNDAVDLDQNRIRYEYTTDDTNWVSLTMSTYATSPIANRQAAFTLPEGTTHIRFRAILEKRTAASQAPKWNSIKFRYRYLLPLDELDPRFSVTIPAFMAARQPTSKEIKGTQYGWTITFPVDWWVLPEAPLHNLDVIAFLKGTYENFRFEVQSIRDYTFGQTSQILHKDFRSEFIRDTHDLQGIVHYLI